MIPAHLRDKLAIALEHAGGTHTIDDVDELIAAEMMQLWEGPRSIAITEVIQYPRVKACRIFAVAGDMGELWSLLEPAIARWAKDHGCARLEGFGRMGWQRVAPKHGYDQGRVFVWRGL